MKTAIVVNTLLKSDRWMNPIAGLDPVSQLLEKLSGVGKKEEIHLLLKVKANQKLHQRIVDYKKIEIHDLRTKEIFLTLFNALSSYEDIIYVFIDSPLLDIEIAKKMLFLHRDEFAEYTYGEGFPVGFTPEIVKRELLPKLATLVEKDGGEVDRDSLFSALSKEINSFDIETYFSTEDLKIKRIELTTSLKRNALVVERVIERKGISCSFEEFCTLVHSEPELLRTVPSYVEMEITNRTHVPSSYSPVPFLKREQGEMDYDIFHELLGKLCDFSETFYMEFSYLGEPLLHGDIKRFIERAISDHNIHLIIETDGTQFTPVFSDYIAELSADNLSIIFAVDTVDAQTYTSIHGGDLNRVERNIRYLLSKRKKNVYCQMIRVDDKEEELLKFFNVWEKEGAKVIIQKYNSYLGLLPERSVHDLRPLERMSCWHLQRDLVVFHNGDVPRCKQDINGLFALGNLIKEEISSVWERGKPYYLAHCEKKYDEYCSICDEFYTFNF
jgi:spiro-SPASM protein